MNFIATFSQITGKSTIHAEGCRVAKNRRHGRVAVAITARTADDAAARFESDNMLTALGRPYPCVCKCCGPRKANALAKLLSCVRAV